MKLSFNNIILLYKSLLTIYQNYYECAQIFSKIIFVYYYKRSMTTLHIEMKKFLINSYYLNNSIFMLF